VASRHFRTQSRYGTRAQASRRTPRPLRPARRPGGPAARARRQVSRARARRHELERRRRRRAGRAGGAGAQARPRSRHDPGPPQTAMTDPRRRLPAVDALLAEPEVAALAVTGPRGLVVRAVRETIEAARANGGSAPPEGWSAAIRARVQRLAAPSLGPVINATGVVLHTNLGRAPLAAPALAALARVGLGYANLEYDLSRGARGSRHALCRDLLVELTGAEDAVVLNHAARAVLVALSGLARGGAAIVSRGELVASGGACRIPDIRAS